MRYVLHELILEPLQLLELLIGQGQVVSPMTGVGVQTGVLDRAGQLVGHDLKAGHILRRKGPCAVALRRERADDDVPGDERQGDLGVGAWNPRSFRRCGFLRRTRYKQVPPVHDATADGGCAVEFESVVSGHPATSLRAGGRTQDGESLLGVQQIDAYVVQAKTLPDQVHSRSEQHPQVEGGNGGAGNLGRSLDLQGIAMERLLQRGADALLLLKDVGFACPEVALQDGSMVVLNLLQAVQRNIIAPMLSAEFAQYLADAQNGIVSDASIA